MNTHTHTRAWPTCICLHLTHSSHIDTQEIYTCLYVILTVMHMHKYVRLQSWQTVKYLYINSEAHIHKHTWHYTILSARITFMTSFTFSISHIKGSDHCNSFFRTSVVMCNAFLDIGHQHRFTVRVEPWTCSSFWQYYTLVLWQ